MLIFDENNVLDGDWRLTTELDRSGYTVLVKIPARLIANEGNVVQLIVRAPAQGGTLSSTYISHVATSGRAYSADTTPTQITWDGSASLTLTAGERYVSDAIPFNLTHKAIVVAFNVGGSTKTIQGTFPGCISYYKAAVSEADDTTRGAGYSGNRDTIDFLEGIMVY